MEGNNRQGSYYGLPAWKIATISNNHSRRINNLYYNKFGRTHQQTILSDGNYAGNNLNSAKIKQPPVLDNQFELAMESSSEIAATNKPGPNDPENYISRDLEHPSRHDKQLGLEVKSEMNSDSEAAVIFEPCKNEPELVGLEMDGIVNRIQALEERVLQLENEIQQQKELNQKSNRGIISLNGNMVTSPCSCRTCSVEPQE